MSNRLRLRTNTNRKARPGAPIPPTSRLPVQVLAGLMAMDQAGEHQKALPKAEALLVQWPDWVPLLELLGSLYLKAGDAQAAARMFSCASQQEPDKAEHFSNLGVCYRRMGQMQNAANALLQAMELAPQIADIPYNLGNLLRDMGQNDMALQQFARAIELCPTHANAMLSLGVTLVDLGHAAEAQQVLRMVLNLAPDNVQAMVNLSVICDFEAYHAFTRLPADWAPHSVDLPGLFLHFEDNAAKQLQRSRRWALARFLQPTSALQPPLPEARIRVGFLSADYHEHATMRLFSGVLREYDRSRFAFHAFSYDREKPDEWRQFAIDHHDGFHDITAMSDAEAVDYIRAQSLDVLIDLKGFTKDSRSHLLGARLAPVQVAWLGFPGSMGHFAVDYAIVDQRVVPPALKSTFDEKLVWMPHSYQPNDNQRAIHPDKASRADHGLPDVGFVFCTFNHTYKISPVEFDIWMRLLAQVEGSVLWLLKSNAVVQSNLCQEAAARGIDPARLIFAEPRQHNDHLGRIAHADLFLDSFAVNAHTTTSDALWAGLPVLTMAGEQFAARVGASLLTAAGLPELVTQTHEEYEALALELARNPTLLGDLRARLAQQRLTCALFDTAVFTRHFEQALGLMHQRRLDGLTPVDFNVG
ncbi:tetratricopeptide repeat protein [Novosphingobium umbonatum]|uniref:protein O-GlcNAc transferase n=1 Tax=Novosphingobium umbonatum TaxID=1908524 RepID=A0A437ND13_9SPHN|nr:tetratricopeptide repeat protein [Novosphingobium umbonatum]RVU07823.1 tetratricopeptide repeat protein [Novosphingobium umbonatum]